MSRQLRNKNTSSAVYLQAHENQGDFAGILGQIKRQPLVFCCYCLLSLIAMKLCNKLMTLKFVAEKYTQGKHKW